MKKLLILITEIIEALIGSESKNQFIHQSIKAMEAKNIIMKMRQINESNNPKYLEWDNEIFQRTNTQA